MTGKFQGMRSTECLVCHQPILYHLDEQDFKGPVPVHMGCQCDCGRVFQVCVLTGHPWFSVLTPLYLVLYPTQLLDYYLENRFLARFSKWMQRKLNTSKYHIAFGFFGLSLLAWVLHHAEHGSAWSPFSAFIWLFMHGLATWWSWQKIRSGAGDHEDNGVSLDRKTLWLMRDARLYRGVALLGLCLQPVVLLLDLLGEGLGAYSFMRPVEIACSYLGFLFVTAPHTPPSQRQEEREQVPLGAEPEGVG